MEKPHTSKHQAVCTLCDSSFVRREHLVRHMRIHTRERPFQCSVCDKSFSRQDVLSRHTASHDDDEDAKNGTSSHQESPLATRACKHCASSRVRCSRQHPCKRCSQRQLICRYPTTRKSRHSASETAQQTDESSLIMDPEAGANESLNSSTRLGEMSSDALLPARADIIPTMSNNIAEHTPGWMDSINNTQTDQVPLGLYDFTQPILGISGVNWMSPRPYGADQWDNVSNFLAKGDDAFPFFFSTSWDFGVQESVDVFDSIEVQNADFASGTHSRGTTNHDTDAVDPPSIQSPIESSSATSTNGRFYADGAGGRAPFGGRLQQRSSVPRSETIVNDPSVERSVATDPVPIDVYECMIRCLERESQQYRAEGDSSYLPSYAEIQTFVKDYFEYFHPIFPLLRKSTFASDVLRDWILLLAVATVGSRYNRESKGKQPSEILLEVLHQVLSRQLYGLDTEENGSALFTPWKTSTRTKVPRIQTLQAGILAIMCMLHSGKQAYTERAVIERHYLIEACNSLDLLSAASTSSASDCDAVTQPNSFQEWVKREFEVRSGMMIWLIDSMCHYELNSKRLIDLANVQSRLPTDEDIWESSGHSQPSWEKLSTGSGPLNTPTSFFTANVSVPLATLPQAIEMLYREHRLPTNLGDFSHSLLINAIYVKTQDFQAKEKNQLDSRAPAINATPKPCSDPSSAWFPNTPAMSHWRNSACDCLDVLHWSANSKAAIRYGVEHHTILHLHLSRLILLTPAQDIQTFATTSPILRTSGNRDYSKYTVARDQILQWVVRDQFKARLCVVHCGALFWHVRRHSCNSIMEPYAIYIATLVLWAFCASSQFIGTEAIESYAACQSPLTVATSPDRGAQPSCADDDDDVEPLFLHLDRPIDDELVQIFVKSGYKMSAYIMGVGDIQAPKASTKILEAGIRLLGRSRGNGTNRLVNPTAPEERCTWGIEASFRESLKEISRATESTLAGNSTFAAH